MNRLALPTATTTSSHSCISHGGVAPHKTPPWLRLRAMRLRNESTYSTSHVSSLWLLWGIVLIILLVRSPLKQREWLRRLPRLTNLLQRGRCSCLCLLSIISCGCNMNRARSRKETEADRSKVVSPTVTPSNESCTCGHMSSLFAHFQAEFRGMLNEWRQT